MQYVCNIFPDFGFSNLLHETEWDPCRRYIQNKRKREMSNRCRKVNKHV